jgi:WD40 repeat protein
MVMEYLEGTDLDRLVRDAGPLPAEQGCACVAGAAEGLRHLHEHGMVHRDIKPRNLLVTAREQQVKILDLGLVRFPDDPGGETAEELTRDVRVLGTRPYMAPEQALDPHAVDARADLYSLGCTFYYLLTGRSPARDAADRPAPVEAARTDVPPGLTAVVDRLRAWRREDRFQTAEELLAALAALRAAHPVAVPAWAPTPPAVPARAPALPMSPAAADTPTPLDTAHPLPPERQRPRRRLWPWLVAAGAGFCLVTLLACAGVLAVFYLGFHHGTVGGDRGTVGGVRSVDGPRAVAEEGQAARSAPATEPVPPPPPPPREPDGALGKAALLTGHSEGIDGLTFLPGGTRALSCSHREFILWDLVHRTKVKVYDPIQALREKMGGGVNPPGPGAAAPPFPPAAPDLGRGFYTLTGVAVTPDGKRALLASMDNFIFWDLDKWKEIRAFGPAQMGGVLRGGVAVSADGTRALHVDSHDVVHLYDLQKEEEIQGAGAGHVACFFPDGRRLLVGQSADFGRRREGTLRIYDPATVGKDVTFPARSPSVDCVAVDPEGKWALSGGEENDVLLWDLAVRQDPIRLRGHTALVTCVAFAPDGKRALSGSQDGTVRLWDLRTHQEIESFRRQHQQAITCVAFSPGGGYTLSGSADKTLGLWPLPE